MPSLKYLIDSNILIDHLSGKEKARDWFNKLHPREIAISFITRVEVLAGCSNEMEDEIAKELLDHFYCFYPDAPIIDMTVQLRREYGLKLPDAFQAALALENNVHLVTRNTKDFPPKRYEFVRVPYVL